MAKPIVERTHIREFNASSRLTLCGLTIQGNNPPSVAFQRMDPRPVIKPGGPRKPPSLPPPTIDSDTVMCPDCMNVYTSSRIRHGSNPKKQ